MTMLPTNQFIRVMIDAFTAALSDEYLYMVAYKNVRTVTYPPWWAFWRKPETSWEEIRQPGCIECHLVQNKDGELMIYPGIYDTPWAGCDRIVVVNDVGTIIAGWPGHIACDKDGPKLKDWIKP